LLADEEMVKRSTGAGADAGAGTINTNDEGYASDSLVRVGGQGGADNTNDAGYASDSSSGNTRTNATSSGLPAYFGMLCFLTELALLLDTCSMFGTVLVFRLDFSPMWEDTHWIPCLLGLKPACIHAIQ
jgi:hypothetical protein